MNILITGAFGLVGTYVLDALEKENHTLRCFDVKTKRNLKIAKKYLNRHEVIWGDIRSLEDNRKIVENQDVIIHLAAILPPITERNRTIAEEVNISGLKNLITAVSELPKPPKLLFSSSVSIYGDTRSKQQPISIEEEFQPTEDYARHKILGMNLLKQSSLQYAIFVLGVITPVKFLLIDPKMFETPIDTNIELLHPLDIGKAYVNSISNEDIWYKTHHIAGGASCRVKYYDYVTEAMSAMGIGALPKEAFGGSLYHSSFMSSEESEQLLNYQKHSYKDIISDMKKYNKLQIIIARMFKPLFRRFILRKSPYYKK